jgi:hypothetical protein
MVLPAPIEHLPGSFHQRTRRAAHLRSHPDLGFLPTRSTQRMVALGRGQEVTMGEAEQPVAKQDQRMDFDRLADAPLEAWGWPAATRPPQAGTWHPGRP